MKLPVPTPQSPSANTRLFGETVVTSLSDGCLDVSLDLLSDATERRMRLSQSPLQASPVARLNIGLYAIQNEHRTTLIDAGANGANGWGGRLPVALAAAQIDPDQVAMILLTHAHRDHIGGLLNHDGSALFPNAEIVLHEDEFNFIFDDVAMNHAPKEELPPFIFARKVFGIYARQLRLSRGGEVIAGIKQVVLPGHSPGHCGYQIEHGSDALLIWGDLVHFPEIQIARPDVSIAFDFDPSTAIQTRKRILDIVATERFLIGGMHLNFPGFIRVERTKTSYEPILEP